MAGDDFDLIVIGSGPAGEKGAAQAAYFGKRVALVERERRLGGAGVNTGTLPSKTLRETALYFSGLRQRGLYGIDYSINRELTVPDFMYRKDHVVRSLWGLIEANLGRHRVELVPGYGELDDPHSVRVTDMDGAVRCLHAPVILIATGSYPNWPDGVARDPERLYDSDTILQMESLPKSLAVVGAGVIGCEYTTTFRALGLDVTLVCGQDRLLPFLDEEISEHLRARLVHLGVSILLNESVEEVVRSGSAVRLRLSGGGSVEAERVLFATGRMGATRGLGLERVGIGVGPRGHVKVNEHYQTEAPHIYAAGDVIGFPALASTSMEQARVAMCHAFDLKYKPSVSTLLPMAVYTIPEVAAVGETERSCREKGVACCVGRARYEGNSRGQIIGDVSGLLKLVFSSGDRRLLGVHAVGEMASELVHVGQACLHFGGTIDYFIQAVFNYPTLAEAYKYAAYDGLGNLERAKALEPSTKTSSS